MSRPNASSSNSGLSLTMTSSEKQVEIQAKFCQNRVTQTEKHLGLLCETIGSMNRKSARMRDKGDILAKQLIEYAKTEDTSHSLKNGLLHFSENLSAIQDYRQAGIQRVETKVLRPLSDYGNICKQVKSGVKTELTAIKKEQKTVQQLQKVRTKNPADAHQISRAETEVQKASADASIGSKALETQLDLFEKNRIHDLKNIMIDFVNVEMMFHARALEFYSKCFESLALVDEERDLDEFRRKLRLSKGMSQEQYNQTMDSIGTGTSSGMSTTIASGSMETDTFGDTYGDSSMSGSGSHRRVRINTRGFLHSKSVNGVGSDSV
ncbi:Protein FAM92A1 [Mizuhopecten yessoensis]|uniref:Protein FAM92A1 n=1 Tax=Mizuhopecten yessoensis TaxID=6573 RepID=A0A210QQP0_MIZYE|nr:Protein FAM92A1 [Mizuhopecten yessoensis]